MGGPMGSMMGGVRMGPPGSASVVTPHGVGGASMATTPASGMTHGYPGSLVLNV